MHNEANLNLIVNIGKLGLYTTLTGIALMGTTIVVGLIYVGTAPNPNN